MDCGAAGTPRPTTAEDELVGRFVPDRRVVELSMSLPERRKLPHDVPSWVSDGSLYFITICGHPRGMNQFCSPSVGSKVLEAAVFYHAQQLWHASVFLLMPDHVHALLCFPRDASIKKTISNWKAYVAKTHGVLWQRDFFEHRLRSDESHVEKAMYIRNNPVRAGLVSSSDNWTYFWQPDTPW
ncbi:MAG: hypothetical protein V1929_08095 [bacterium]